MYVYIYIYIYTHIYIISVEKAAPTGTSLNTCEQVQLFSQLKQIVPSRQVVEAHPLATGLQKSLEDLPAGPGSWCSQPTCHDGHSVMCWSLGVVHLNTSPHISGLRLPQHTVKWCLVQSVGHKELEDAYCTAIACLNRATPSSLWLRSRSSFAFQKGSPSLQRHHAMGPCTHDSSLPSQRAQSKAETIRN